VFRDEDVFDALTAIALVTSGVLQQHAATPKEAQKLLDHLRDF